LPNYKNTRYFSEVQSGAFDVIHNPGELTPVSGIYRCVVCGFEVTSIEGRPLPPERSCAQHGLKWRANGGPVRWQLAAATIHIHANN
jgi:hypothetical protein